MYTIETHLHTTHTSKCGWLEAPTLTDAYKAAGYDAIAVTDHYNRTTFEYLQVDLHSDTDKVEAFLTGYHRMAEEGQKRGLVIYKGAELRFDECDNDYLLYNWPDELLADPESIFRMGIAAFAPLARQAGALLIQAHPFRKGCTPAIPCYLDGIETVNLNPRHDNRNERAVEFADQFQISLRTSGSDCHRPEDIARGGIRSETLPDDEAAFVALLRSGNYSLIDADLS